MASPPKPRHQPPPQRPIVGAIWAAVAMAIFSVVPVCVRYLSDTMTPSEIIFFRSLMGVGLMLIFFAWHRTRGWRTGVFKLHGTRAVINYIGMVMWFFALARMPLADAVAIQFTLPLFVVILAVIFLGERVGIRRTTATLVGFCGVLVILRPGFEDIGLPAAGVLGSAVCYAGTVILIKFTVRTDSAATVTFYSNLLMMILSFIPSVLDWASPTWDDALPLLGLGLAGTIAPYCVTRALEYMDASLEAAFDFLRLPFTAFMAYLFFTEVPSAWTWVGAAIIFASTYYITQREAKLARRKATEDGD